MKFSKTHIGLLVALLLGNVIVLYGDLAWVWLRFPAALLLTFILPGWAWLPAFGWMQTRQAIERLVLLVGVSSLLSALVLLIAVLWPGPFTETPVLISLNLAIVPGWLVQTLAPYLSFSNPIAPHSEATPNKSPAQPANPKDAPAEAQTKARIEWPTRTVLLILLAILAVAAFTRLTRLGYSEFHEDELENMRLIVRAYKGEEYAPFLDSKGPIHWLLPAALWYLNGWLNEGIARTPVALTSLLLIPMMYVLGRRISNGRDHVGLLAAGFVAMNGFFVALARHVENRSLIVFWGALAIWFAYRYYKEKLDHFLIYLALTLAIGLIAHPNVLLYLPAVAFVIWLKLRRDGLNWRSQWPRLAGAGLVFVGLLALFYVPYLTDPHIGLVYQYFAEERVGQSLFYNRVGNLFGDDRDYSTPYHAPIMVLLLTWLLARKFARWGWLGWLLLAGFGLAFISTVLRPEVWIVGDINLALVPYLLFILIFTLLPRIDFETKVVFLWFSVPFSALLLLAKDANNHVQVAYTGWALLAALALSDLWAVLRSPKAGRRLATVSRGVIILILTVVVPLILYYQYLTFDAPVTTYWRARVDSMTNPDSIYNRLYRTILRPRKLISNPRLGGWKVVGYLWKTGVLSGDFRSVNESFAVPIWYTFQTPRSCYTDPQHYWLRRDWEGWPEEEQDIIEQGYNLTRVVLVDQEPKLHLYEKKASVQEPEILDLADYRRKFDRLTTPARFAQEELISHPTSLNFGDKLLLHGYNLPGKKVTPGDLIPVSVYWEALAPMETRYRGFVHLIGPDGELWGQHDDDPACRLLTSEMRPGQRSSRQFRVPVDPSIPPGQYELVFGLYDPATFERLDIWNNLTNRSPGDHLILGQVTVE